MSYAFTTHCNSFSRYVRDCNVHEEDRQYVTMFEMSYTYCVLKYCSTIYLYKSALQYLDSVFEYDVGWIQYSLKQN